MAEMCVDYTKRSVFTQRDMLGQRLGSTHRYQFHLYLRFINSLDEAVKQQFPNSMVFAESNNSVITLSRTAWIHSHKLTAYRRSDLDRSAGIKNINNFCSLTFIITVLNHCSLILG